MNIDIKFDKFPDKTQWMIKNLHPAIVIICVKPSNSTCRPIYTYKIYTFSAICHMHENGKPNLLAVYM